MFRPYSRYYVVDTFTGIVLGDNNSTNDNNEFDAVGSRYGEIQCDTERYSEMQSRQSPPSLSACPSFSALAILASLPETRSWCCIPPTRAPSPPRHRSSQRTNVTATRSVSMNTLQESALGLTPTNGSSVVDLQSNLPRNTALGSPTNTKARGRKRTQSWDTSPGSVEDGEDEEGQEERRRQPGVKRACNECRQQKVSHPMPTMCPREANIFILQSCVVMSYKIHFRSARAANASIWNAKLNRALSAWASAARMPRWSARLSSCGDSWRLNTPRPSHSMQRPSKHRPVARRVRAYRTSLRLLISTWDRRRRWPHCWICDLDLMGARILGVRMGN